MILLVAVVRTARRPGITAVLIVQEQVAAVRRTGGTAAALHVRADKRIRVEEELPVDHVQVQILHAEHNS